MAFCGLRARKFHPVPGEGEIEELLRTGEGALPEVAGVAALC